MTLLQIKELSHRFHHSPALQDITLSLEPGEIHGLVGENGAGKSTLIKLLTGVYTLQEGELLWEGKPLQLSGPQHSLAAGIQVIHQDRQLIPAFTALENIYLGLPYVRRGLFIDRRTMGKRAQALLDDLGLELDLHQLASALTPAQKTVVELVRILMRPCQLLILDEPTASLTDRETAALFGVIERLRQQGTAVLYVSHRLDEIFRLTDRVTVLRNGRLVATVPTVTVDQKQLIAMMTDVQAEPQFVYHALRGTPLLEVHGLSSADGRVRRADFTAHSGEILGIFGLSGSGRTELLECVYGSRAMADGQIRLNGQSLKPRPDRCLQRGMVLISEDRLGQGLVPTMSVGDNMLLSVLHQVSTGGYINGPKARRFGQSWMERFAVKADGLDQPVLELSGGNQQKVVFVRALLSQPQVLLCDEPTQAIDVGARAEIHRLLRQQADEGKAVVFVSSDLEETLEICDRLVVMIDGHTGALLENDGLQAETVLHHCYGEEELG